MVTQGEDLHETLAGEYHNEYHVQIVQHVAKRLGLLIMVQRHREHVQPDEQHDYHIELFVRHYFEYYRLRPPLKNRHKAYTNFVILYTSQANTDNYLSQMITVITEAHNVRLAIIFLTHLHHTEK